MLEIVLHGPYANLCCLVSKVFLVSRPGPTQGYRTHIYTLQQFIT